VTARGDAAPRTPSDWRLLVEDETEHWTLPDFPGARVETVYLFNAAEHTYCCELTPSYWLVPVETRGILPEYDAAENPSAALERKRDALQEAIYGEDIYDGHYRYVHEVNLERTVPVAWDHDPEVTRDEEAEAVEEYCRCNSLA